MKEEIIEKKRLDAPMDESGGRRHLTPLLQFILSIPLSSSFLIWITYITWTHHWGWMTNVLPLNHQLSRTHTYRAAATRGNYQHLPGTRQPIKMFHYLQFKELLEAKHPPTSSLTRTSIHVSPDQKHLLDVCFTSTSSIGWHETCGIEAPPWVTAW